MLEKTAQGYIKYKNGVPHMIAERCPAHLTATHGNVIALSSVREITIADIIKEVLKNGVR